jgi:Na+/H+-dicarboxylate symporter
VNGVIQKQSLVDQLLNTANSVVPNNVVKVRIIYCLLAGRELLTDLILQSFATASIISVIIIGICLGVAITLLNTRSRSRGSCDGLLLFCNEMSDVTNVIITWIISIAPLCVGFLVAASLASAGNLADLMSSVGIYVGSAVAGMLVHVLVTLPILFIWFTNGENPYKWLFAVRQPLIIAFSTESSVSHCLLLLMACMTSRN